MPREQMMDSELNESLRVALVSNRGPVSFEKGTDGYELKGPAGGAAPTLHRVSRRLRDRAVWFANAISDDDRAAVADGEMKRVADELGYRVELIDFDTDTYRKFYDVVSNRMLWFANHCLWDELDIKRFGDDEIAAWDEAYVPVNMRFAEEVAQLGDPSWLVLFQDYHFSLAPRFLRELSPDQVIFHFTHSSFCGPSGLARLPDPLAERVITGMLGADLVGFHVRDWVEGFLSACAAMELDIDRENGVVRHGDRRSWVREYPIAIDAADLRRRAANETSTAWAGRFRSRAEGQIVVRADRLEPSKNVIRGFLAFASLLERRQDLRNTSFIACLYPSRQTMPEYRRYAAAVQETVEAINHRFPDAILFFNEDDFERTLGAYRSYDVLLVNSIMDGMNLVAKEGVAVNERDGALVLSRQAGVFEELGKHAIGIDDPLDVEATSAALEAALDMPRSERRHRAEELRTIVNARTSEDWIYDQLRDLEAIRDGKPPLTPPS